MNAKLLEKFEDAERKRNKMLDELKNYSDEILNTKPSPDSWSPIQVIHHLILSEQNTVGYLRKKSLGLAQARKTGLSAWIRINLTRLLLSMPFLKRQAPPMIAKVPDSAGFEESRELWQSTRDDLKILLDQLPESATERALFRHPFAGMFNLLQMLDFLTAHAMRHDRQIKRALESHSV